MDGEEKPRPSRTTVWRRRKRRRNAERCQDSDCEVHGSRNSSPGSHSLSAATCCVESTNSSSDARAVVSDASLQVPAQQSSSLSHAACVGSTQNAAEGADTELYLQCQNYIEELQQRADVSSLHGSTMVKTTKFDCSDDESLEHSISSDDIVLEHSDGGSISFDEGDCRDDYQMHFLEEQPLDEERNGNAGEGHRDPHDSGDSEDDEDSSDSDESSSEEEGETFSFDDAALNTHLNFARPCSVREVILLNLANTLGNNWTYESLIDSLSAWATGVGRPGVVPSTKKQLWSFIKKSEVGRTKYAYCPRCFRYAGKYSSLVGPAYNCPCTVNTPIQLMPWFLMLSLRTQLQQFLSTPGMADRLQYRHQRERLQQNALEDIFDGQVYQDFLNGTLAPNDLTYVINADGFLLFKHRSLSVWALYIRLNELPPELRQRHLFLVGLWVGNNAPHMNTFLRPFIRQANQLSSEGLQWSPDGIQQIRSRFYPLSCCVDAPARSKIMNQHQYNGAYGCYNCTHRGVFLDGSMKYPTLPFENLPAAADRTHDSIVAAMHRGEFFEGQVGPSQIMLLDHYDMGRGNAMDDLHPLYEGVASFYLDLLLNSLEDRQAGAANVMNLRMQGVRTPTQMARKWVKVEKRGSWKGSAHGYFIRYFSVLCFLDNQLPLRHVEHLAMLSYALFVQSQDSIRPQDLDVAEQYLERFLQYFQDSFGPENMRFNVHQLRHVVQARRNMGPAWTVSTFNFESWNRKMGLLVTSAKGAAEQMADRHLLKTYVHSAVNRNDVAEHVRTQCSHVLFGSPRKLAVRVHDNVVVLGRGTRREATPEEQHLLRRLHLNGPLTEYDRVLVRGIEFRNRAYHPDTKSDNSDAYTWLDTFVTINNIIVSTGIDNVDFCALFVTTHVIDHPVRFAHHIARIIDDEIDCVAANVLRVPATAVTVQNTRYLVPMANCHEID